MAFFFFFADSILQSQKTVLVITATNEQYIPTHLPFQIHFLSSFIPLGQFSVCTEYLLTTTDYAIPSIW